MPKILVVENNADVAGAVRLGLENAGYEVILAVDGREGLHTAVRERPDLIITGVDLPVMGGFEFYKKLKEDRATAIIPVLVLSDRGAMADAFRTVGADAFLARPFEDYVLLSKVAGILSRPAVLSIPALPDGPRRRLKVLVADVYEETAASAAAQLRDRGHLVKTVLAAVDVISRMIVFEPDLLVMNIQVSGGCTAPEIIEVVRAIPKFKDLPVVLYNYFRMADLGSQSLHEKTLSSDALQLACIRAGASEYIGEYKELSFLEKLDGFL